jgi:antitoxin (DNA-binding transcriptional repressor) of toxin-antitoxin stability system
MYIIIMKTIQVGELKTNFSSLLKEIQLGNEIVISFGRKKEKIAIIVPYEAYMKKNKRKLGSLKEHGKLEMNDFEMTNEELLGL